MHVSVSSFIGVSFFDAAMQWQLSLSWIVPSGHELLHEHAHLFSSQDLVLGQFDTVLHLQPQDCAS
jgi:hypothetical protein